MLPSTNGQVIRFSFWQYGFDSRWKYQMRNQFNGRTSAFQAECGSSILLFRSIQPCSELGIALCLRNKGLWVQIPPRLPYTRITQSAEVASSNLVQCRFKSYYEYHQRETRGKRILGIKTLIANVSSERRVKLGQCTTSRFQKHDKNYYLQQ